MAETPNDAAFRDVDLWMRLSYLVFSLKRCRGIVRLKVVYFIEQLWWFYTEDTIIGKKQ